MIEIKTRKPHGYVRANDPDKKGMGLSDISNMIREGNDIFITTVKDGVTIDITRETLLKCAFLPIIPHNTSDEKVAIWASLLEDQMNMEEDIITLVIENGGLDNYLNRKARGLVCN